MRKLLTETKLQTETMLQDDKLKTVQAAEIKLQAAKSELQAAEIKWTNYPSNDGMKGILLDQVKACNDQVKTCHDQVKACHDQVKAWGDRVSTILNQVSSLEVMQAPAGITHVVCSRLSLSVSVDALLFPCH